MSVLARPLPLVAVVSRVPLFVEALRAAFDGIADIHVIRPDDPGVEGFLDALAPDALIVEGPDSLNRPEDVPILQVDLERGGVCVRTGGNWETISVDLSPEAIRNAVVGTMLGSRA